MRFRKLRIAWSVFWGVACVLLIALWVRSYLWIDSITMPIGTKSAAQVGAAGSRVFVQFFPNNYAAKRTNATGIESFPLGWSWRTHQFITLPNPSPTPLFGHGRVGPVESLTFPCWISLLL